MAQHLSQTAHGVGSPTLVAHHQPQMPHGETQGDLDGVVAVAAGDGLLDYVGICTTHQRASLRFVSLADADRWRCPVCLSAFSEAVERQRYLAVMAEVGGRHAS